MRKKTDAIKIKDKSFRKSLSPILESTQLILLVVVKMLKNRSKI